MPALQKLKSILQNLKERTAVCRLSDMTAPVLLETPFVEEVHSDKYVADYVQGVMEKWNFALTMDDAKKALEQQRQKFFAGMGSPERLKLESPKRRLQS